MGWLRLILLVILLCMPYGTVSAKSATAGLEPFVLKALFGCESYKRPCVIFHNLGGGVGFFTLAEMEIRLANVTLIINGECDSACSMLADSVREHVCITKRAKFGFHLGSNPQVLWAMNIPSSLLRLVNSSETQMNVGLIMTTPFVVKYSPHVEKWIQRKGGLPPNDHMLYMYYKDAKKFWKTCSKKTVRRAMEAFK